MPRIVLVLVLLVLALPATARQETAPDRTGDAAAAALERIDRAAAAFGRYAGMLATASAEDSLVLRLQMDRQVDDLMEAFTELRAIVAPGAEQPAQRELQGRLRALYLDLTPRVWTEIARLRDEIDRLRARRRGAEVGDRLALEADIADLTSRLDRILAFGADHVAAMAAVGMDTTAERATLTGVLESRADELEGRLALGMRRGRELQAELKERPDDADLPVRIAANKRALDANAASLAATLAVMQRLGLPTGEHRALLVTVTQDLAAGLMDVRVTATLARRAWRDVSDWLTNEGPPWLAKLLLVAAILFAGRLLARLVEKAVRRSVARSKLDLSQLLQRTAVRAAHNAVMALALMVALAQLGISLGPLLAGLGVAGFVVGFAMQDSLSNFAAGMMILVYRPYDVGDVVEVGGVFGKVENMSLVSTSILTFDNQTLVVPNSKIWGDVIKNVTDQDVRRVDMVFGISYSDDIPAAERVLGSILADHELVLDEPEPMVRVHTLNESSVDFVVRPWVKTPDYWDVYWDVTREVKLRFDAEGISIPFPQRDVHLHQVARKATAGAASDPEPYAPTHARQDDPIPEEEEG